LRHKISAGRAPLTFRRIQVWRWKSQGQGRRAAFQAATSGAALPYRRVTSTGDKTTAIGGDVICSGMIIFSKRHPAIDPP
jgi:hypothetical protein